MPPIYALSLARPVVVGVQATLCRTTRQMMMDPVASDECTTNIHDSAFGQRIRPVGLNVPVSLRTIPWCLGHPRGPAPPPGEKISEREEHPERYTQFQLLVKRKMGFEGQVGGVGRGSTGIEGIWTGQSVNRMVEEKGILTDYMMNKYPLAQARLRGRRKMCRPRLQAPRSRSQSGLVGAIRISCASISPTKESR